MIKKTISLLLIALLAAITVRLQAQTLSGIVTDAENRQPLEGVMISLLRQGTTIDYALTDAHGRYSLPWKHSDTLQVSASLLGYRREMRDVRRAGRLDFAVQPEAIVLKEVLIRPGRINTRKDTVRYDLAQFASSRDVHIKDVLKRLPGVDVEENGQVKYKGKAIDHYFVEGMDVTGGRYNQINNNLSARAVKSAEIMENYQSVKALKGKISSDEVALNLKLDPKARDQWIANATLGAGRSDGTPETSPGQGSGKSSSGELLWDAAANALQLGKGNQSVYNYKTNNAGRDLSREQSVLINNTSQDIPLSHFLAQPGISAPLDKERLLFNRTHTLNGNRMYKWNDERSLRLQAGYTHDRISQQRGNTQTYYQPDDTLTLTESYRYRLLTDAAHAEAHYEDNNARHYLSNRFLVEGEISRGTSRELQQTIRTSQLTAKNFFNLIRNGEQATWEFSSATQYACLPSSLSLPDGRSRFRQQNLYSDHKASYLKKRNGFTRQYTAGAQGEWATVKYRFPADEALRPLSDKTLRPLSDETFDASNLSLYLSPYFQLERERWLGNITLPLNFKRYFARQRSLVFFNPSLYLRYQLDYHWRFSLYGSLTRSAGDATDLCPFSYQTDYRTWRNASGLFPVSTRQLYNLYGEYKNTVQEFFVTATLAYQRTRYNTLTEQSISDSTITYTRRPHTNHTENWSLSSTLSKGFFDWNLKTSLNLQLSRSTGQQLTQIASSPAEESGNSLLQKYRYDYLQVEPKLIWSPVSAFEAEYHATIGYGGSKIGTNTHLTPLLDVVQRLHLTFSIGHVDLRLSGEHYRNDLNNDTHLNTVFADVSLIYKTKKWRLETSLNNLFNKKEYAYTLYSATQSSTSWLNIRPREAMAKASYQF
ncbi:carboxypeptidase regulatory-like domain-containing protein [Bacteroides sp.]|uniref:carboxypeptidase regulatory-like domain-containing protein n=1 Tax=Bacteroides sp. TaxID=29523 RepID=UPI003AB32996